MVFIDCLNMSFYSLSISFKSSKPIKNAIRLYENPPSLSVFIYFIAFSHSFTVKSVFKYINMNGHSWGSHLKETTGSHLMWRFWGDAASLILFVIDELTWRCFLQRNSFHPVQISSSLPAHRVTASSVWGWTQVTATWGHGLPRCPLSKLVKWSIIFISIHCFLCFCLRKGLFVGNSFMWNTEYVQTKKNLLVSQ